MSDLGSHKIFLKSKFLIAADITETDTDISVDIEIDTNTESRPSPFNSAANVGVTFSAFDAAATL